MREPMKEPHAIARARERYGIVLTMEGLRQIERDVRDKKALLLSKRGDGSARYAVMAGDVAVIAAINAVGFCSSILPRTRTPEAQAMRKQGVAHRAPKRPPKSARKRGFA